MELCHDGRMTYSINSRTLAEMLSILQRRRVRAGIPLTIHDPIYNVPLTDLEVFVRRGRLVDYP